MQMPERKSQKITITIDLTKPVLCEQVTVRDNENFEGTEISHADLAAIANDPTKGLRWRLSVVHFPGSDCWVVQMPDGERVFC